MLNLMAQIGEISRRKRMSREEVIEGICSLLEEQPNLMKTVDELLEFEGEMPEPERVVWESCACALKKQESLATPVVVHLRSVVSNKQNEFAIRIRGLTILLAMDAGSNAELLSECMQDATDEVLFETIRLAGEYLVIAALAKLLSIGGAFVKDEIRLAVVSAIRVLVQRANLTDGEYVETMEFLNRCLVSSSRKMVEEAALAYCFMYAKTTVQRGNIEGSLRQALNSVGRGQYNVSPSFGGCLTLFRLPDPAPRFGAFGMTLLLGQKFSISSLRDMLRS